MFVAVGCYSVDPLDADTLPVVSESGYYSKYEISELCSVALTFGVLFSTLLGELCKLLWLPCNGVEFSEVPDVKAERPGTTGGRRGGIELLFM